MSEERPYSERAIDLLREIADLLAHRRSVGVLGNESEYLIGARAELIREAFENLGLTYGEIAEIIGASRNVVQDIVNVDVKKERRRKARVRAAARDRSWVHRL